MSDTLQSTGARRRSRFALPMLAAALLVLATASTVAAASGPNGTVGSGPLPPIPAGDGATRINPDPTVKNPHRTAWDHIVVKSGGTKLVVYFWMGIQDCNGLGKVDFNRHDGQVDIKLWTGTPAGAGNLVCPEIAQLYKTVIRLSHPIFGGSFPQAF